MNKLEKILTSRTSFLLFSFCLILYIFLGLIFLYSPGGSDYWEHLATIYHLSENLVDTSNAYVILSKPFFLNTPYHIFWGLVSKIFSVHPFWLLPLIGVINSVAFLIATVYLSKYLTNSRKYALITALTLLFFWYNPWGWSGFYHFGMLPMASIYPFWITLSLSLIIISKIDIQKDFLKLIIYIIVMAMVFLMHPLTGSFLFLGVSIKSVTTYRESVQNRILMLLTPFLAFLLSMLWPYYSVGEEIFKITDTPRYFLGPYWQFYIQPWKSILPALVGLVYLPIAVKNKHFNFVIVGLFAAVVIFIVNRYTFHSPYLSRYLIFICFFLQVSIVMLLKIAQNGLPRRLAFLIFFILMVIFGANQIQKSFSQLGIVIDKKNGTSLGTYSNINYFKKYKKIGELTSKTDIVFAPIYVSWILPGITGCRIVGSPHAEVFETDDEYRERWNDTELFFRDSTFIKFKDSPFTNNREELINKYNVQFVLVPESYDYSIFDKMVILDVVYISNDYKLYKVKVD